MTTLCQDERHITGVHDACNELAGTRTDTRTDEVNEYGISDTSLAAYRRVQTLAQSHNASVVTSCPLILSPVTFSLTTLRFTCHE